MAALRFDGSISAIHQDSTSYCSLGILIVQWVMFQARRVVVLVGFNLIENYWLTGFGPELGGGDLSNPEG